MTETDGLEQSENIAKEWGRNGEAYRCPHCQKVVGRISEKQWIKSYCTTTEKDGRLQKLPPSWWVNHWESGEDLYKPIDLHPVD